MRRPSRTFATWLGVLLAAVLPCPCPGSDQPDPRHTTAILTPPPGRAPRLNGPKVYGGRPGRPFLYRVPCTGERPIRFAATGLPEGLALDPAAGIIRGKAPVRPGTYDVILEAASAHGSARRPFRLIVGDTLALTPPMGWNDWYTHYDRITDARVRAAAEALIASGMADFGYAYVNIDDCWAIKPGSPDPQLGGPVRDQGEAIRPNGRFPDMKALTDFIHSQGLKAGIYTSPGPRTCAGFEGSYQHEERDARAFADWGFDFLKYDWCSYGGVAGGNDREHLQAPYRKMGEILAKLDRDIVFNLCQYGMGEVWTWGGDVGGHCWRTTGDLGLEQGGRLPAFFRIGLSNARLGRYARPGRWNDPDYLLIGRVGDARHFDQPSRPTSLTDDEQYSYMAMWCLMAAPLFFSGDMERLDPFTLNVLCNAEVIDVDQDPLGRQALVARRDETTLILAKPMEDGSLAVGLFNLGEDPRRIETSWRDLEISGPHRVRDLWRQKDLDFVDGAYAAQVGRHGVRMIRLWPRK